MSTWVCDLHDVVTTRDCPRCDDELIALAVETTAKRCRLCDRALVEGEMAWADDWTVIGPEGTRTEVRYTCDACEELS